MAALILDVRRFCFCLIVLHVADLGTLLTAFITSDALFPLGWMRSADLEALLRALKPRKTNRYAGTGSVERSAIENVETRKILHQCTASQLYFRPIFKRRYQGTLFDP